MCFMKKKKKDVFYDPECGVSHCCWRKQTTDIDYIQVIDGAGFFLFLNKCYFIH